MINRNCRLEERRAVAVFTGIAGQYVILIFANRIAAVVAAYAVGRIIGMIEGCGNPAVGRMTGVAIFATCNVGRILANSNGVVMARRAGTDHLRMINPVCRCKQDRAMAVLTNVAGQNMIEVFADRIATVVATKAISRNIGVIEIRRQPGHRGMAVVTIVTTGNVTRDFAGSDCAVMAGTASTDHLGVVNSDCGRPDRRIVAILAIVAG